MKKLLLLITVFYSCSCFAQKVSPGDLKQLFRDNLKDDIEWSVPGRIEAGSGSYWIERDTLFACGPFIGRSIAMADIDFTNKSVRLHDRYCIKNTTDKVYMLTLSPLSGKKIASGLCYMGDPLPQTPDAGQVELYMRSMEQADLAFQYLKKWKSGDSPQRLKRRQENRSNDYVPPATENSSNSGINAFEAFLEEEEKKAGDNHAPEENPNIKEATDEATPAIIFSTNEELFKSFNTTTTAQTASSSGFDPQLGELMNGYKNGWGTLKGTLLKGSEYQSTANLEGSVTTIGKGLVGESTMLADFGEYDSKDEAQKVYDNVVNKVEASKEMPVMMVKQNEYLSESGRTTVWVPFDPPEAFKNVSIWVEMLQSRKFDKELHSSVVYVVVLRIETL